MRWSQFFLPTLREDPKDAEAISHKLMLRAGLIRRLGSGAYSYLPLGVRALLRIIAIIRQEMEAVGAQECLLPALQPLELWKTTGRDTILGDVLIRFKDRTGKELALGPTHEEVITSLVSELESHRDLPLILYQIQTKFRDEPRPRFGVIRSKEFLMKDAYSFDIDEQGLSHSYQRMFGAYQRIFARCGLTVLTCEAASGAMGGSVSHEFMAPAEIGEDLVVRCSSCDYAANQEAAVSKKSTVSDQKSEAPQTLEEVTTPGKHTVEQVSQFLKVPATKIIKTLLYETDRDPIGVLIRGDHEVNEVKLARATQAVHLRLAAAVTIERLTRAPVGFAGPVGLAGVRLVADPSVMDIRNGVAGANKAEAHVINVNPGRDFKPSLIEDIRMVTSGEPCSRCGKPLEIVHAIEVGHVFKLGTKYSQVLGAMFQDGHGKQQPMVMGCYGIGVNRIMAALIEQRHDQHGLIWPAAVSPFQVLVSVLEADKAELLHVAEQSVQQLEAAGVAVLFDDRLQSPGSKLKDADLIGLPVQVIVGKAWQAKRLEIVERASKTRQQIEPSSLVQIVKSLLDKPAFSS